MSNRVFNLIESLLHISFIKISLNNKKELIQFFKKIAKLFVRHISLTATNNNNFKHFSPIIQLSTQSY